MDEQCSSKLEHFPSPHNKLKSSISANQFVSESIRTAAYGADDKMLFYRLVCHSLQVPANVRHVKLFMDCTVQFMC